MDDDLQTSIVNTAGRLAVMERALAVTIVAVLGHQRTPDLLIETLESNLDELRRETPDDIDGLKEAIDQGIRNVVGSAKSTLAAARAEKEKHSP